MGICALLARLGVPFEAGFDFSRHTTIGCGGTAEAAAFPASGEELIFLLSRLKEAGVPYCFMGAGANVLPADGHFEGVVVRFCRINSLEREGNVLYAGAGVTGGALLKFARENAVGGLEAFSGIPMSVGGGIAMNAGIPERHFSDLVLRVVAAEHGRLVTLSHADCRFSEKDSLFREEKVAVVGAVLRAEFCPPSSIWEKTCRIREKRRRLSKGHSMGCAFVNPKGISAGALIESCGLKGVRVGGASVSNEHANFLINEGGSAADVARLAALVRQEVHRKAGIWLREEFCRLP